MLIDRTHRAWAIASAIVLVVSALIYAVTIGTRAGSVGGTVPGLAFGTVGLAMMIGAALLSARKQVPARRLGSAKAWLKAHIWLGLLSVPMVLFHAGFGWGGRLENLLWILFAIVILSGLFGLALQQVVPRIVTSRIPLETFVEQMPFLARRRQFLLDKEVAVLCGPLQIANGDRTVQACRQIVQFKPTAEKSASLLFGDWPETLGPEDQEFFKRMAVYAKDEWAKSWKEMRVPSDLPKVLPNIYEGLAAESTTPAAPAKSGQGSGTPDKAGELKRHYVQGLRPVLGEERLSRDQWRAAESARQSLFMEKTTWPNTFWPVIDELRQAFEESRQYALQRRLYLWLHSWLWVHVPISMALFVLVFLYVVSALRVIPFGGRA